MFVVKWFFCATNELLGIPPMCCLKIYKAKETIPEPCRQLYFRYHILAILLVSICRKGDHVGPLRVLTNFGVAHLLLHCERGQHTILPRRKGFETYVGKCHTSAPR
jgi:hypothetical protein